jgi:hypothetical protein
LEPSTFTALAIGPALEYKIDALIGLEIVIVGPLQMLSNRIRFDTIDVI